MGEDGARPTSDDDREGWWVYWAAQGMPWRTEPVIGEERQQYLVERQAVRPDIAQGVYPFRDESGSIVLNRADVEWLIARGARSRDVGLGHINEDGAVQDSGLDLRGADLHSTNLRGLPLSHLVGGLAPDLIADVAAGRQRQAQEAAAIVLDKSDLGLAHLDAAILTSAHLSDAGLVGTHLEEAFLLEAHLDHCNMIAAQCQGAFLVGAHLVGIFARNIHLESANLSYAMLSEALLDDAHCEGTTLRHAHLEGASLQDAVLCGSDLSFAHLEGARLNAANLGASRTHSAVTDHRGKPHFDGIVPVLEAANLYGCFFSSTTDLQAVQLGESKLGYVRIADAHFDGVNLGVIDWQGIEVIGDERAAHLTTKKGKHVQPTIQVALFQTALRANRQLSVALRAQGMNEEADHFAYRAQILSSQYLLLRLRGKGSGLPRLGLQARMRLAGSYLFSLFLNVLAGYGYSPGLALLWYGVSIGFFSSLYFVIGAVHGPHLSVGESLVFSLTSFHGRGFFPANIRLDDPMVGVAAGEAVWGLLIELSFIATFTQRFFAR